jgi:RsiW-degrading membrane proteinase PrsW (M82 family)
MHHFQISLQGLNPDADPSAAKANLQALLKAQPAAVEQLLMSLPRVLKRGLTLDEAEHYRTALAEGGAVCVVEPEPATVQLSPELPSEPPPLPPAARAHARAQAPAQVPTTPPPGFFADMAGRVTDIAGVSKLETFSVAELFAQTFKKHHDDEVERLFTVGTRATTPSVLSLETNWPQPWMFMRALFFAALLYGGFHFLWNFFHNENLLPGLILTGSFAVPIATLVFFFEMNVPRNVSLYQMLKLVLLGGVASLAISLLLFDLTALHSVFGASSAGIVEEAGKLLALVWLAGRSNNERYRFTLNGLLFGAAVGTGFAAFESAGYAFRVGLHDSVDAMFENIVLRGVLAPAGHIVWTALAGAALWKVKRDRRFAWDMLSDASFMRVFALVAGLHFIWNLPFELPFYAKFIVLGFVAWTAALAFIQHGLREIRQEQIGLLQGAGQTASPPVHVATDMEAMPAEV